MKAIMSESSSGGKEAFGQMFALQMKVVSGSCSALHNYTMY